MKLTQLLLATSFSALTLSSTLYASSDHMEGGHDAMSQDVAKNEMFLVKKDIDGYNVSFHVMKADEGMNHGGGNHNVMIKVESNGTSVDGLNANSKVVYPDGTEKSKPLMKMGDWYMAGYDLEPGSKHQLMVLFMTPDGKKHFGGVHYQ